MKQQVKQYLGIDLGGTKTEVVVLEALSGAADPVVFYRERLPTPSGDYEATLDVIASLVARAEERAGPFHRIGIGTPGAESAVTGAMKNCNSTCLNGRYLQQDLSRRLNKQVFLANDANCFALSEAVDGAGRGLDLVFGVIIGTGVGGGVVVKQQVLQGANRIAGEWGHNPMPEQACNGELRHCYCGKTNCVETFLSGPGFSRSYEQIRAGSGVSAGAGWLTAQQIAGRAEQGEPDALKAIRYYSRQLAAALAQVINILDPDAVVLGGGMSNIPALYRYLPEDLPEFVFSDQVVTRILPPVHGDSSGVRGAAWLTRPDTDLP